MLNRILLFSLASLWVFNPALAADARCGIDLVSTGELTPTDFFRTVSQSVDLSRYSANEYGWLESKRILKKLRTLGSDYTVLATDPGLILSLDDFVQFASRRLRSIGSPWEMRQRFAEHLGNVTYYRAITLSSEEEARDIPLKGMDSPFLFAARGLSAEEIGRLYAARTKDGIPAEIRKNLVQRKGTRIPRLSLSISRYPDVAASVASAFGEKGQTVYIFQLDLNSLDIVELGDIYRYPFLVQLARFLGLRTGVVFPDGSRNYYLYGPEVESFVLFRIPPNEIKAVYKVPYEESVSYLTGLKQSTQLKKSAEEFLSRLVRLR